MLITTGGLGIFVLSLFHMLCTHRNHTASTACQMLHTTVAGPDGNMHVFSSGAVCHEQLNSRSPLLCMPS